MLLLLSCRILGLSMLPLLGNVLSDVSDDADDGDACTMKVFVDPNDVVDFIELRRSDIITLFAFKMCKFFILLPTMANAFFT